MLNNVEYQTFSAGYEGRTAFEKWLFFSLYGRPIVTYPKDDNMLEKPTDSQQLKK